jgi:hypothetical protein
MKFFVLLVFISCPFFLGQVFLCAQEYQPTIHSLLYRSFLEDPVAESFAEPQIQQQGTDFAVSSIHKFEHSFSIYLSQQDQQGIFFRYSPGTNQNLMIRILGGIDYNQQNEDHYFFLYKGLRLKSQFNSHLSLDGYWWAGQFRGDKKYYLASPLIDSFYQPEEDVTYFDNLQGSLKYTTDHVNLSIGRGKFQVGDNISGSVILNNAANDYGYFASKMEFGTLSLTYLHGALTPDQHEVVYYHDQGYNSVDSSRVDKFLVMHKLDWSPSIRFNGFLGEEIIYGNRSLDLNYLMPHVLWRIIEHNLEDRDNVLIFCGFKWKVNHNITFYENTMFDEFSQNKILTDWWGSKYALQSGISYLYRYPGSAALNDDCFPRVTVEMTAVRPWTYTHFIKWNKFSNDGIALGYPIGSNCINYSVETDYPINSRLFISVNGSYSRQGSTGDQFYLDTSDLEMIPDSDHYKTRWLAGKITDTTRIKFMTEWKPLAHHFIRVSTALVQTNKSDWDQDLAISYRTEF